MKIHAKMTVCVISLCAIANLCFAAEVDRRTNARLATVFEKIYAEAAKEQNGSDAQDRSAAATRDAATVTNDGGDVATSAITTGEAETELATFGTGCFWCTEAVFEQLKGVRKAVSGYSGGQTSNPSYKQVCTGLTGHAEVVQIEFDPQQISFEKLLEAFWRSHDPTTLNRQGEDVGTQYRSAIFFHSDEQRDIATRIKQRLDAEKVFEDPIVTEITPFSNFFEAENYHQDYFALNGRNPYCRIVILPKMRQFRRVFKEDLKQDE